MHTDQVAAITERTVARHWDRRFGYCTLDVYPPPDTDGLKRRKRATAHARAKKAAITDFHRRYGYWPIVVLHSEDGTALGPRGEA